MTTTADELLRQVHARTGLGIDIQTYTDGTVEIRWKRDYGEEGWSEMRPVAIGTGANALSDALLYVLKYEDEVDASESGEEL